MLGGWFARLLRRPPWMLASFHEGRFRNLDGTEELSQDVSALVVIGSKFGLSDVCLSRVEVRTVGGSRSREGVDRDGSAALVEIDGFRGESGQSDAVAEESKKKLSRQASVRRYRKNIDQDVRIVHPKSGDVCHDHQPRGDHTHDLCGRRTRASQRSKGREGQKRVPTLTSEAMWLV